MRRFINADVYVDTGNSVLSTNMFAYCENNPVNMVDPNGEYATGALVLPATSALSGALAKLMASISVSMASIKAAMVTSAIIVACVAATAVAIAGIIYAVNKVKALYASAASAISAVKSRIGKGGVNSKKLKKHTVYVIVRKNTKDVVYVGRTLNYSSRMVAHKRGSKFNGFKTYTMMPIATNLSLSQARALEQAIISAYTIDTLKNMINSISPKKWSNFKTEFRQMQTLMQSWVDPE
jgi:predicted GIY-YIG superfamily endonuclease